MEETNVSKLGNEIGVTEDDISGSKVQMNDNLAPFNGPRRLRETKLGPGYHSFLKWRIAAQNTYKANLHFDAKLTAFSFLALFWCYRS